jgi:GH18 family chitinase
LTSTLQTLLAQTPYDGIDFDDESSSATQHVSTLTTLIPAVRSIVNGLGMTNFILTYPAFNKPTDYNDAAVLKNASVVAALNWINVMSYEGDNVSASESDLTSYAAIFDKSKLLLGIDLGGDMGGAPSDASLSSMAGWVKTNGYGGMMICTINDATSSQTQAIIGGL